MNTLITKRCSPIEEMIYQDGFQAGAASRDAEVARLEQENDQLREQVKLLREALTGMEKWASKVHDGYPETTASRFAAPCRKAAQEALATTEPKP